jgi:hypothetical protein
LRQLPLPLLSPPREPPQACAAPRTSREREREDRAGVAAAATSCDGWQDGRGGGGHGGEGLTRTDSETDIGEAKECAGAGAAAIPEARTRPGEGAEEEGSGGGVGVENKEEEEEEEELGDAAGEGEGDDNADATDEEYEWEEEEEYDYEEELEVDKDVGSDGQPTANYSAMTIDDMWYRAFDCVSTFRTARPIHNESTWTFLRGVYLGVMMTASVEEQASQHGNGNGTGAGTGTDAQRRRGGNQLHCDHGPTINLVAPLGSGFRKAVQAKQTDDGKGRGVYAAERIRRGELVWTSTSATARFPSGALYRQFLAIIPSDLACDVLQWAYVQDVAPFRDDDDDDQTTTAKQDSSDPQSPTLRVSVDLDEGSYMNGEDYDPNVGCLPVIGDEEDENDGDVKSSSPPTKIPFHCQQNFYALREIHVGEELLCSYGDFAHSDGWAEFGL